MYCLKNTGHICRNKDSLLREVIVSKLNKTRPRAQRNTTSALVRPGKGDLNQAGETASMEDADNRHKWKNLVERAKCLNGL